MSPSLQAVSHTNHAHTSPGSSGDANVVVGGRSEMGHNSALLTGSQRMPCCWMGIHSEQQSSNGQNSADPGMCMGVCEASKEGSPVPPWFLLQPSSPPPQCCLAEPLRLSNTHRYTNIKAFTCLGEAHPHSRG